jgi:hypothetical protein
VAERLSGPLPAEHDVVAAQLDAEAARDGVDRVLERLVGERLHLTRALVDEMMVVAVGVRDLEPRDAVTAVEAVQQAELEQLIDHPIHRGRRASAAGTKVVGDLLCAHQALSVPSEHLDHGCARGAGTQSGAGCQLPSSCQPPIAETRVHAQESTCR